MSRSGGAARAAGGGEGGRLQAEMLQLDLIDASGDAPAEEQTAPAPLQKEPPPASTDSYRPKRPTTLNLFPQVPRSQVSAGPGGSPGTGSFWRGWVRDRGREGCGERCARSLLSRVPRAWGGSKVGSPRARGASVRRLGAGKGP